MTQDSPLARRSFIKSAGIGLGIGLVPAAPALAQTAPAAAPGLWSAEYWAKKGEVPLYLYRKRLGAPTDGEYSLMNVFARQDAFLNPQQIAKG